MFLLLIIMGVCRMLLTVFCIMGLLSEQQRFNNPQNFTGIYKDIELGALAAARAISLVKMFTTRRHKMTRP
ncbi:hypothetical protein Y1Q_0014163 [Alligator mississippiensis]|uniref:Uncharacterized protein n=1 Tax=Alligator mississippiensis TaxID=8496 RepID=A0A151MTV6_ALLMI|nr:hypothetical protein Y1Q_0014163 [Alligator mississippiensis]